MTSISFDARVRDDRRIGFYVPTSITTGSYCQFNVTITTLTTPATVLAMMTFTAEVTWTRKIIFTVPNHVPLGMQHFTVLITVLSAARASATFAATAEAAQDDAEDVEIATPQEQSAE
jgi:hypothetical protein